MYVQSYKSAPLNRKRDAPLGPLNNRIPGPAGRRLLPMFYQVFFGTVLGQCRRHWVLALRSLDRLGISASFAPSIFFDLGVTASFALSMFFNLEVIADKWDSEGYKEMGEFHLHCDKNEVVDWSCESYWGRQL